MRSLSTVSLVSILLLVCGCGSSGGDTGGPSTTAAGDGPYYLIQFAALNELGMLTRASFGRAVPGPDDTLELHTGTENFEGVVSNSEFSRTFMRITDPMGNSRLMNDISNLRGRWTTDDAVGVFAPGFESFEPQIAALVRIDAGITLGNVTGTYLVGGILGQSISLTSFFGRLTFDGAGGFTGALAGNIEGVATPLPGLSGTYSVTGAGRLSMTFESGDTVTAGVGRDGEILIGAMGMNDGGAPGMLVAVREGSGHASIDLFGTYTGVGFVRDSFTGDALPAAGLFESDEFGIGLWGVAAIQPGGFSTRAAEVSVARVMDDGESDLELPAITQNFSGGVCTAGDFIFKTRDATGARLPGLWLLVR